jgi:hypothetical protein
MLRNVCLPLHIQLRQTDEPAAAEHRFNHERYVQLQNTKILSAKSGYVQWFLPEATRLEHHVKNMNRQDCLILSGLWKPLFNILRESRWRPPNPPAWFACLRPLSKPKMFACCSLIYAVLLWCHSFQCHIP